MDKANLKEIFEDTKKKLKDVKSVDDIEEIRKEYLGKKGILANLFKEVLDFSEDNRKEIGKEVNDLKKSVEKAIEKVKNEFFEESGSQELENLHSTLPGKQPEVGHINIITQAIREIVGVFTPLGFNRMRYPEVDWENYAFETLNIPETHPARDEWETFFVDLPKDEKLGRLVITPHTSNGQVRDMLRGDLPIRMLNISRCGRRQSDVSHNLTFFQFEGLVVDKGINISHLKGVLDYFAKNFYGEKRKTRLRPHDFRFTEPSFEVDISCGICNGKGCRLCNNGWLELGGAGMVHPKVLKYGGVDPEKYTGFAFGWGVERTFMMKSGTKLDDIRYLMSNDLKFLEQF